jgi:hypothetical protein
VRRRYFLLSTALGTGSCLLVTAKKVFDYSAAPEKDKQSDFTFPREPAKNLTITPAPAPSQGISFQQLGGFANDASHLNQTPVYGIIKPTIEDEIRNALKFAHDNGLKVSCAGQQHSMGGQTFTRGGLVLDLSGLDHIELDTQNKVVRVGTGTRWWQLQQKRGHESRFRGRPCSKPPLDPLPIPHVCGNSSNQESDRRPRR